MATSTAGTSTRDFLFVQSTTEIGGAETVLLNLFEASEELRRRSVIATLGFGDGDLPARLRRMGVEVIELPRARVRQPVATARAVWRLRNLARARGVRVLVGNGAHPQILAGAAARLARRRSVFLVHMIHHLPLWKNPVLDLLALRGNCDLMLANSRASLEALQKLRPGVPSRLLPLGTPMRTVAEVDVARVRGELGVGPGEILVGVFGRLQRWKGQDVFVEAAARLLSVRPDVRFAIVGGSVFGLEPEFREGLERRVAEAGFGARMVMTGYRPDVAALMAACDVVCHTSRFPEPFGMVIVEAMALGRPVIATRGGGPSEIIEPGVSGLLTTPEDARELAEAIGRLAENVEERLRLGRGAADRVRAHFTIERTVAHLMTALDAAPEATKG